MAGLEGPAGSSWGGNAQEWARLKYVARIPIQEWRTKFFEHERQNAKWPASWSLIGRIGQTACGIGTGLAEGGAA